MCASNIAYKSRIKITVQIISVCYNGQILSSINISFCIYAKKSLLSRIEKIITLVPCDEHFTPHNCELESKPLLTVEDYERCAPSLLPLYARNYFQTAAGRGYTRQENRDAFNRIKIYPKMMRDVSGSSIDITTLNQRAAIPIGISPSAYHKLAHPDAELATVTAAINTKTIMIVSSFSSILIEDVARMAQGSRAHLWMQLYIFHNRSHTINILRRAERCGFKAIVLTVDSNILPKGTTCHGKDSPHLENLLLPNLPGEKFGNDLFRVITFRDIKWLKSMTTLPIVAKGLLSGEDARMAVISGASALMVSNHGGRQLDFTIATIDALPAVVDAIKNIYPRRDVYLDSGVRNGFDVYKAIARGAKMVFIGRPVLWGLTIAGAKGVENVLNILATEFNETMLLAGASNPSKIREDTVSPAKDRCMEVQDICRKPFP